MRHGSFEVPPVSKASELVVVSSHDPQRGAGTVSHKLAALILVDAPPSRVGNMLCVVGVQDASLCDKKV